MSVVINGFEMPKSCFECWALDDNGDYPRCRITQTQKGYNFPTRKERMDDCPLLDKESEYYCLICKRALESIIRRRIEAENKPANTAWHYNSSSEPCSYP